MIYFFFFNDTATTEIYTLSLHDALPISMRHASPGKGRPAGSLPAPAAHPPRDLPGAKGERWQAGPGARRRPRSAAARRQGGRRAAGHWPSWRAWYGPARREIGRAHV